MNDHRKECAAKRGGKCDCLGACGDTRDETGLPANRCPYPLPELDAFSLGVLRVFDAASQDQWEVGYAGRVGIPVDRMLRVARLMGYQPEELFFAKWGVCVRVVINADNARAKAAEDQAENHR